MVLSRIFVVLIVLVQVACSAGREPQLYRADYDEEGFVCSIQEIERGDDFTVLRLKIIEPDAQGGIVVAMAASRIGAELGKTHFAYLRNDVAGDGVHLATIGFTNDPSDGAGQFQVRFDEQSRSQFEKSGYLSVEQFAPLWKN